MNMKSHQTAPAEEWDKQMVMTRFKMASLEISEADLANVLGNQVVIQNLNITRKNFY